MCSNVVTGIWCVILFEEFYADTTLHEYEQKRNSFLETEMQYSLGSKILLSDSERLANDALMRWKNINTDNSFNNSLYLDISEPFFMYKDAMRRSKGYQMIRRMPKGAALHVHSTFMLEPEDLLKLTYEENLYACITIDDLKFRFSDSTPKKPCAVPWTLVSDARSDFYYNINPFDELLLDHLTVDLKNWHGRLTADKVEARRKLVQTISTISSLISYRPVHENMIYQSLQNFYDDKIMYVEIRTGLDNLYELNGTMHDKFYTAVIYNEVARKFMKVNSDFIGAKLIITGQVNGNSLIDLRQELNLARKVKEFLPEIFAGYDLVGRGKPLKEFLPALLEAKDELNYFFNPGETNQYGSLLDENLLDAVLLGAKRIGHGNALIKHPVLIKTVQQNDIAIECNVISNSVLSLIPDLRNHPLATYLAVGLPVVLSSSNPSLWGVKPLSDDFYVAFVGIASKHADLRMLKQLAINSIKYSALDDEGKTKLFKVFHKRWIMFLQEFSVNENDIETVILT